MEGRGGLRGGRVRRVLEDVTADAVEAVVGFPVGQGFNQGMEEESATWVSDAGVHNSFRFVVGFFGCEIRRKSAIKKV